MNLHNNPKMNRFTWVANRYLLFDFLQSPYGLNEHWCEVIERWPRRIYFDIDIHRGEGTTKDGRDCFDYIVYWLLSASRERSRSRYARGRRSEIDLITIQSTGFRYFDLKRLAMLYRHWLRFPWVYRYTLFFFY